MAKNWKRALFGVKDDEGHKRKAWGAYVEFRVRESSLDSVRAVGLEVH